MSRLALISSNGYAVHSVGGLRDRRRNDLASAKVQRCEATMAKRSGYKVEGGDYGQPDQDETDLG